jgi:hypothetical protein
MGYHIVEGFSKEIRRGTNCILIELCGGSYTVFFWDDHVVACGGTTSHEGRRL